MDGARDEDDDHSTIVTIFHDLDDFGLQKFSALFDSTQLLRFVHLHTFRVSYPGSTMLQVAVICRLHICSESQISIPRRSTFTASDSVVRAHRLVPSIPKICCSFAFEVQGDGLNRAALAVMAQARLPKRANGLGLELP
jgi:hypothetical protein